MQLTKRIALSLALAICSAPTFIYAQVQQRPEYLQLPLSDSVSQTDAPLKASPRSFFTTPDALAYHAALEPWMSSSRTSYAEAFAHETHAAGSLDPSLPFTPASAQPASLSQDVRKNTMSSRPFSHFAVGVKVDTLGAGLDLATPLARSFNLRAGIHYTVFGYNFNVDGINYTTNINFRSAQLGIDWFPFHGGFHVSPGFLYFRNTLGGRADIPPGQPFSLSDTHYINSVDDPVSGTASVVFNRHVAPVLTVGWGNMIPRSGRHWSVPFEVGFAYTGAGLLDLKLAGTACTTDGCFNAATDPDTQANLQSELKDLNNTVKKFAFYPILSLGFAYRF